MSEIPPEEPTGSGNAFLWFVVFVFVLFTVVWNVVG